MTIIATRSLIYETQDSKTVVLITIHSPRRVDDSWVCPYEVDWPHGLRRFQAAGLDAIQALHITMQMIGSEIYSSPYHASGNLFWERRGGGYGFPVADILSDLLIGDDARPRNG